MKKRRGTNSATTRIPPVCKRKLATLVRKLAKNAEHYGVKHSIRSHQVVVTNGDAIEWLVSNSGVIMDKMGSGKS